MDQESKTVQLAASPMASTHSPDLPMESNKSIDKSPSEFFERNYFEPLESLNGENHSFIIVLVSLTIYEHHVRVQQNLGEAGLPDSSPFFLDFAKDFGLEVSESIAFWRTHRNGLAHRCFPNFHAEQGIRYEWNRGFEKAIEKTSNGFKVNPLQLRNHVISILRKSLANPGCKQATGFPVTIPATC